MSSIGDDIRTTAESMEQSSIPRRMQSLSNQEDIPSSQSGGKSDNLRSWVWKHYSIIAGPKSERKALCIYCKSKISCAPHMGTTSLSNHLTRCHKSPFYKSNKKLKAVEMKSPIPIFDQDRCRKALAIMITVDELPFSHVEKEGFRNFCHELQPNFEIPSRATVTRDCYNLFLEERKKTENVFWESKFKCLSYDRFVEINSKYRLFVSDSSLY